MIERLEAAEKADRQSVEADLHREYRGSARFLRFLPDRLRHRGADQGMVADLLAGRRDPVGLRPRRGARRFCLGLARRQDRPAHGVHLVGGDDLAGDRHHGVHAGTGRALIPGWLFLMFFRFFVGIGNAGIFTIDLPLVQEFIPAYKRGWVSALITTLLPGGGMLAGLVAAWLLPIDRLALPLPGRAVAARAGVHDPLLGAGIAALADADGPHGRGPQIARLGADDRSQGDRPARDGARRRDRRAGSNCSSIRGWSPPAV